MDKYLAIKSRHIIRSSIILWYQFGQKKIHNVFTSTLPVVPIQYYFTLGTWKYILYYHTYVSIRVYFLSVTNRVPTYVPINLLQRDNIKAPYFSTYVCQCNEYDPLQRESCSCDVSLLKFFCDSVLESFKLCSSMTFNCICTYVFSFK